VHSSLLGFFNLQICAHDGGTAEVSSGCDLGVNPIEFSATFGFRSDEPMNFAVSLKHLSFFESASSAGARGTKAQGGTNKARLPDELLVICCASQSRDEDFGFSQYVFSQPRREGHRQAIANSETPPSVDGVSKPPEVGLGLRQRSQRGLYAHV
jgi:hypothetical protein